MLDRISSPYATRPHARGPHLSARLRLKLQATVRYAEPILLCIAVPLLLFPRGYLAWLGIALLAFAFVAGALRTRVLLGDVYLKHPVLILFVMSLVGLYLSVDRSLSLPKFYGILLGLGIFCATIRATKTPRRTVQAAYLISALTVAVALIGAIGTEWNAGKFPLLQPWRDILPRFITSVPTSFGPKAGINPNELGGTLAFLLPVPLALLLSTPGLQRKLPYGLILLVGLACLALSGSRSGFIAFGSSVVLLSVWYVPRLRFALAAGPVVTAVVLYLGHVDVLVGLSNVVRSDSTAPSRIELWTRAVLLVQDFPFTGIGLNTFPLVLDALYPSFATVGESLTPHAHNVFLQTAADLGLAGLVALLGVSGFVVKKYLDVIRRRSEHAGKGEIEQGAVLGMIVGILSYLIFGLTDAITLGAKPTVLVWFMLGVIVARERTLGSELAPISPSSNLAGLPPLAWHISVARFASYLYWVAAYALVFLAYLVVALTVIG